MAQRRMFSLKIIDSDLFLDMPSSSQLLYFHLAMRGDDDGFVSSPKKIMKFIGCSDDDFKILLAKQFLIPFESGVVLIKDWKIHNYIQNDRYQKTHFINEKSLVSETENGSYQISLNNSYKEEEKCIQSVSKVDTQVRLGKDKVGKVSEGKNIYKERVMLSKEEYGKLLEKYKDKGLLDKGIEILNNYIQAKEPKYKSHYHVMIAWVYERVMEDEKSKGHRHERDTAKDRTTEGVVKDGGVSKYTSKNYL